MQISSVHKKIEMPKQNEAKQGSTISMAPQLQPTLTTYSSLNNFKQRSQTMAFALLAILGQRSAHSFPTGPVIADPFISPLGFTITPALSAMQDVQPLLSSRTIRKLIKLRLAKETAMLLQCK
jgi:hypothetical protein